MLKLSKVFILTCLLIGPALAKYLVPKTMKIYEFNFRPQQTIYIHSGTKALLKFTPIPRDIDMVQVSIGHRKNSPRAQLIGTRALIIKNNTSSLDIPIQIDEIKNTREAQYSIELKIKLLKQNNGKYETAEEFSNFIRLILCPTNQQTVCGAVARSCRSQINCEEKEFQENFLNFCEMEKAGARLINYGECP